MQRRQPLLQVPRASSQHTSSAIDLSIPFHLTPSGSKRGVPARLWKSEKSKSATMKTGLAARASILSGIGNLLRIQVERYELRFRFYSHSWLLWLPEVEIRKALYPATLKH